MFDKKSVLCPFLLCPLFTTSLSLAVLNSSCVVRNAEGIEIAMDDSAELVCEEQERIDRTKKFAQEQSGSVVAIQTADGQTLSGTFFDRGSDMLIVMGSGFGKPCETLRLYARVFHDYDVLMFDYRWRQSIKDFIFDIKTIRSPMAALFNVPKEDVVAVARWGKSHKKYTKVIGLGVCYSGYQFLAAQAECNSRQVPLFDALIIDSCPLSVADVQKQVFHDLSLLYNPLKAKNPGLLQYVWGMTGIPAALSWLVSKISDYSVLPLCARIGQVPVLCIHGRADALVPMDSFERLWDGLQTPDKMALITPNSHVMNIRNQAVYKVVCDRFIAAV